jgi:competence protein ComEC
MVSCDVGQGDATVVAAGVGSAMLVDVGPEPAPVDRCLDRLHVRHLPVVAITHAHADHIGGWNGVVSGRDVGPVLVGPSGGPRSESSRPIVAGERFAVGRLRVEVLWPLAGEPAPDSEDGSAMNDVSLVLRVTVPGSHPLRLLLTGDVEPDAQEALLRFHPDLAADVVKMPHHGSGRQSSAFFDAVGARVATISAGKDNDYGHPAAAALRLLGEHHIPWWCERVVSPSWPSTRAHLPTPARLAEPRIPTGGVLVGLRRPLRAARVGGAPTPVRIPPRPCLIRRGCPAP